MNLNQNKVELKLDWCSYQAAKYAVENWHYSKCMPVGKLVKIGVWEDKKYIGCVLFSNAVGAMSSKTYRLNNQEFVELVRIALNKHCSTVSKIIAIAIKLLLSINKKLRLIVSYADPKEGHLGGVYQASNWVYVGTSTASVMYKVNGNIIHSRTANPNNKQFGNKTKNIDLTGAIKFKAIPKYKYLMPLDSEMRKQIEPLRKPYPKKCATSIENDAAGFQPEKGGVIPTVALH